MTFRHIIMTIILVFILLSGCAHYEEDPPYSGEPDPPVESVIHPDPSPPAGTGGGTVLDESEW